MYSYIDALYVKNHRAYKGIKAISIGITGLQVLMVVNGNSICNYLVNVAVM